MIWAILIACVFSIRLGQYMRARIKRARIIQHNQTITVVPFHWTIEAERGTIQHQVCEDTALRSIGIKGDYETFVANTIEDKTEYDKRTQFAAITIRKETARRLGIKL